MSDLATGRFASRIRRIPDYPSPGVLFYDLIPALADPAAFTEVLEALDAALAPADIIAGVEARGFIFAAALAAKRGVGFLAVRKAGKLPPPVSGQDYSLEYGQARVEIPVAGISLAGAQVLLVDDLLATGGTLVAAAGLLRRAGARVPTAAAALELVGLDGRAKLAEQGLAVVSLITDTSLD